MGNIPKKEALDMWRSLGDTADDELLRVITPVPQGHTGSTYGFDGIRIDGSLDFIKAILGRLKPLLAYENEKTRLYFLINEITPREKAEDGSVNWHTDEHTGQYCCYIRYTLRTKTIGEIARLFSSTEQAKVQELHELNA